MTVAWPHARVIGSIGRSVAPARLVEQPIAGVVVTPVQTSQTGELAVIHDGKTIQSIDLATATLRSTAACTATTCPIAVPDRDANGTCAAVAKGKAIACDTNTVTEVHDQTIAVYARKPVKQLAAIDFLDHWWVGSELAIATREGLVRASPDLGKQRVLPLHVTKLLAQFDKRQVVVTADRTVLVLDDDRTRAQLPWSDNIAIGSSRVLIDGRLYALPAGQIVKRPAPPASITLAAELRDLPAVTPSGGEIPSGVDGDVCGVAIAGTELYVATDRGFAAFDLAAHAWTWRISHPVNPMTAIVASPSIVVGTMVDGVIGFRDGTMAWRRTISAGQLTVSNDSVVFGTHVLSADDGHTIAEVPGPAIAIDGLVIGVEHDRLVARLTKGGMLPVWALAIRGEIETLAPTRDGVLVTMTDHDAYLIDRSGVATAIPGFADRATVAGNLIITAGKGGPIPPDPIVPPKLPPEVYHPTDLETAPAIATPWPDSVTSAPMPASTQLTFFDLAGGLRTRNDYAVADFQIGVRVGVTPVVGVVGRTVFEIDATTGTPLRRVEVPGDGRIIPFATVVDQKPTAGMIVGRPLRLLTF
ncbi:MAG: hypothetical protein QM831_27490 [Kofleriaceae bacterium]